MQITDVVLYNFKTNMIMKFFSKFSILFTWKDT